jgi:hypothetical protein
MLAKNPAERFDTPDQVAAALAQDVAGCDLQALVGGPETVKRSEQEIAETVTPRSNRWFWELLALAGVVLLLVFGASMVLERLGPFWDRGAQDAVAGRNPLPAEPQPEEPPQTDRHETAEERFSAESATEPAMTTREPLEGPEASGHSATLPAAAGPSQDHPGDEPNAKPVFAIHLNLDHTHGVYLGPPAGPGGDGELIFVKITSEQPGYLYLLNQQADGTVVCLFPNVYQADNKMEPGRPVTVPDPHGDFELRASPPYGTETLVALVSLEPLEPSKFGVASLTDQQFTVVDHHAVQRLRAEMRQDPNRCAEVQAQLTTRPGDQQESQAPESAAPPSDEPAESTSPSPHKGPATVRPGDRNQLDHQPREPSLLASRHDSGQAV